MDIENLVDNGRIKRIFRTRNKISYPGACCHVTQRAPGRELLFIENADYLYMLHLLKDKSKKFDFEIYSFSLLPNHFHLQLRLKQANLSDAMKNICEIYANLFNKKYKRKGHVFCGPYRQALCFDDSYLIATSLYIHLNPLRAGLVERPQDYRWSSYRLYVENINKDTFVNYTFILKMLHDDIDEARKIYKELIKTSIPIKTEEIWERPNAIDNFKRQLFNFAKPVLEKFNTINPSVANIFNEDLEKEIEKIKTNKYNINPSNIETRRYLIEQLRSNGYKMEEIAKKLDLSRKTLYNVLKLHKTSIA